MNGLLLALDTAGDTLSFALHDGAALLAEHSWRAARQPTTQLAPAVARSLAAFGGAPALGALAVSLGPGSYTGLRSGIGLAQGLAEARAGTSQRVLALRSACGHFAAVRSRKKPQEARGLPLVGIGAHAALVAACGARAGRLWAVVPAGRGRLYARCYLWRAGTWREDGPLLRLTGAELRARCTADDALIGEWDMAAMSDADAGIDEARPYRYPPAANLRRAGYLAELAWQRLRAAMAAGQEPRLTFPPEAIRPIYAAE